MNKILPVFCPSCLVLFGAVDVPDALAMELVTYNSAPTRHLDLIQGAYSAISQKVEPPQFNYDPVDGRCSFCCSFCDSQCAHQFPDPQMLEAEDRERLAQMLQQFKAKWGKELAQRHGLGQEVDEILAQAQESGTSILKQVQNLPQDLQYVLDNGRSLPARQTMFFNPAETLPYPWDLPQDIRYLVNASQCQVLFLDWDGTASKLSEDIICQNSQD